MKVLLITFQAVAALLGIGVLGFWIIGRRRMPANALGLLSSIAIDIALPCLVLSNILTVFTPEKYPNWWQMPLWWAAFTLILGLLTFLTSFLSKKETRGEFAMTLFFQNGIFFPAIVISGIFLTAASDYLVQLFLFIFLQPTLVFSTYTLFIRRKNLSLPSLIWRRVVNSMLIMTFIGVGICLAGIRDYIPSFLITILTMIGAMATPLFMLILGGNVYNDFIPSESGIRKIYWAEVTKFTLTKNLILPLVFLGFMVLIRPDYPLAFIILIEAAVPPITAIPIFTERLGGNRAITSQFIVASFIFSVISIPLMVFLFSRFFPFPA